jgi:hypothetical protein
VPAKRRFALYPYPESSGAYIIRSPALARAM